MEKRRVGICVNTHGIQGECKIKVTTDFVEERFSQGQRLLLCRDGKEKEVHVKSVRQHMQMLLVYFDEIQSMTEAEAYKGFEIYIPAEDIHELEEGFYVHELVGCEVVDEAGKVIGTLKAIEETGANDVLRIQRSGMPDALVPYLDVFVKDIDLDTQRITIHIMEGLL